MTRKDFDVIIVGGGPAGLQTATNLARARWNVLVVDRGRGRSFFAPRFHNLIGFPGGIPGKELVERARETATRFGAQVLSAEVVQTGRVDKEAFRVEVHSKPDREGSAADSREGQSRVFFARRLIFATGMRDRQPDVPDALQYAGHSIHYCPDCDGYEVIGRSTAVIGPGKAAAALALILTRFTHQLTVIRTDSKRPLPEHYGRKLRAGKIRVYDSPPREFRGRRQNLLEAIVLQDGTEIPCQKVFSALGAETVYSELAVRLGVRTLENGHIPVNRETMETNVKNVWAIGDVAASPQMACVAMGEAATAATWVNKSLL